MTGRAACPAGWDACALQLGPLDFLVHQAAPQADPQADSPAVGGPQEGQAAASQANPQEGEVEALEGEGEARGDGGVRFWILECCIRKKRLIESGPALPR